jgi:hypothetical protein
MIADIKFNLLSPSDILPSNKAINILRLSAQFFRHCLRPGQIRLNYNGVQGALQEITLPWYTAAGS